MSDTLVMPTLLSQGYGQIAKMVTVDERMTCEAKCIYALLASFSGGGTTAFPSIDFQCRVLHICRERYYKHRRFLTALGYLTVSQGKDGGKMLNNRYALSFAPKPDPAELAKLKEEWGPKLDKYISPALLASYGACEVPREADPAQVGGENGFSQNPRSAPAVGKPDHGADLGKQQNPRSAPQSEFPTAENPTTIINSVIIGEKQACRPVFPAPPGAGKPAAESCSAPSKAGGQAQSREESRHEPEGFDELAASWPKPVRDRAAAAEAYAAALASGLDPAGIKRAAERYLKAYRAEHPDGEIRYVKQLGPWLLAQDGLGFYARRPKEKRRRPSKPVPSCAGAEPNRARSVKLAELSACELRARLAGDEGAADRAAAQREALLAEIEQEGKGGAPCRC